MDVFDSIYLGSCWGNAGGETRSGRGSSEINTRELRVWLERFIRTFRIATLLDIPCGEWGWMQHLDMGDCEYLGADVSEIPIKSNRARFPQHRFKVIDLTQGAPLRRCDLVLVKDCFQHLSNNQIKMALRRLKDSRCRYLLTSSDFFPWPLSNESRLVKSGGWRPENLLRPPFDLSGWIVNLSLDRKIFTLWRLDAAPSEEDGLLLAQTLHGYSDSHYLKMARLPPKAIVRAEFVELTRTSSGELMALPRFNAFADLGDGIWLPKRTADVLSMFDGDMEVGPLSDRVSRALGHGSEQIPRLLWLLAELGFVKVRNGMEKLNCWQRLMCAKAIKFDTEDLFGARQLCDYLIRPPEWLRRRQQCDTPSEGLYSFYSWAQSQCIRLQIKKADDAETVISMRANSEWISEALGLMP